MRIRPRLPASALFLSLALFLVLVFYIVPLLLTLWASFTPIRDWDLHALRSYVGAENYRRLFHLIRFDPDVSTVVKTTIVFVSGTLAVNVIGGFLLALAAFLLEERVSLGFRLLWLLPRMTPVAVFGLLWYYFFYPQGTLNAILEKLGLMSHPVNWGQDYLPWGPWGIIIFVNGLVGVSYGMIIFYSAFKSIPLEIYRAALVDGASLKDLVLHIMLPLTRWHLIFVTVWQLLSLLTTYAHLFVLVEWGVVEKWHGMTWALYVFETAFSQSVSDQALASAAAAILVAVGVGLGLLTLRLMGFERELGAVRGDLG
ncbi:MAG: sugar ABC transporter permease [Desulfurococcales archaeon]|nr:sugar ABC transporter permease [Desulfurococcales archaeon]